MYFVYSWDTKLVDSNTDLPQAERMPRDGKHTIGVQACDRNGNRLGAIKKITVVVKNHLSSSDLPSREVRLRYKYKPETATKYAFECKIDLKSVRGKDPSVIRAIGEGIEGSTGVVKRFIEYVSNGSAFISEDLLGIVRRYNGDRLVLDNSITSKQLYQTEDALGNYTRLSTQSPGALVTVELPHLPDQPVGIGDVWRLKNKVFWNPIGAQAVEVQTRSVFEGLEWQQGYPCAKIRTVFSGSVSIPFSNIMTTPVQVDGETLTYFSYGLGKVISSTTKATATGSLATASIDSALRASLPPGSSLFGNVATTTGTPNAPAAGGRVNDRSDREDLPARRAPGNVGGPSGMENAPAGQPGTTGAATVGTTEVELLVTESIKLVQ